MDYKKVYDQLIGSAKKLRELKGYTEKHHIVPRCLVTDDSQGNLVRLTAREHFIAHWLLTKIYKGTKYEMLMLSAFTAMRMKNSEQGREFNGNRLKALAFAYSKSVEGNYNPMYGKDPHNLYKNCWYIPETGSIVYSDTKPSPTARKGMKTRDTGNTFLKGERNGMYGINMLENLSENKLSEMMSKRKATFESKTEEQKQIIRKAQAFGYEFNIKGVYYPCLKEAEQALNFSHKSITRRCLSDLEEFSDWKRSPRKSKYIKS